MATVQPALGTTLGCDFTTPSTYVLIGLVTSISGPESEVGKVDTTHLVSAVKTTRPTLLDPGELSFEVDFDPTDTGSHPQLQGLLTTPAVHNWQITYPTTPPKKCTIAGFLTKTPVDVGGAEENLAAKVSVQCTGAPVWS